MNGISIGPIAFDIERFAFVVAALIFMSVFHVMTIPQARRGIDLRRWAIPAALSWLVAARTGFVLQHWAVFLEHPLDMLKLWQGGISVGAGFLGLGVLTLFLLVRREAVVAPIMGAAFVGWLAGELVLRSQEQQAGAQTTLPETAFPHMAGEPVRLDERQGTPLVLNLLASWCPPCRREMPMMMDVADRIEGAELVFANQGETEQRIATFLKNLDEDGEHVSLDPTSSLMTRFNAMGLPTTLFFDASGTLRDAHFGEISRAELLSQIATLQSAAPQADADRASQPTKQGDF